MTRPQIPHDAGEGLSSEQAAKEQSRVTFACTCVICGTAFSASHPRKNACSPLCDRLKRGLNEARCRAKRRERPKEIPSEKVCYRCQERLPADAFGKNGWQPDGLQGMCKACRREYDTSPEQVEKDRERKRFWYVLHHEEMNRKRLDRYHSDPEFRAQHNAAKLARYHADPKAHIDRCRENQQAKRQWEKEGARYCFCGRALPASDEDGPWFCRPACKVRCIRHVCGQTEDRSTESLIATLRQLQGNDDARRLPPEEEALILSIARKTTGPWRGKGSAVSDEDLVSSAYLGAWNAWLTYDSTKGAALHTWLITGARREVLETLRAADPLSRLERQRYRIALAVDPNAPSPRRIVSLDAISYDDPEGDPLRLSDHLAAETAPDAIEQIHAKQMAERIFSVFRPSEQRLADVVRLVGLEGLTMKQVAAMMGISESRVHQLWAAAKKRIVAEVPA